MEFDSIFITGATEDEFPSFFSVRDSNLEEERRLFYVAMTRAKQRLFISAYSNFKGFSKSVVNLLTKYVRNISVRCNSSKCS